MEVALGTQGSSNEAAAGGGVGFTGLLLIAFIVLKLTGLINWSWVWVLSPFWIPLALVVLVVVAYALYKGVEHMVDRHNRKKRQKP